MLNKQGLYDGCMYLCVYVVECALKARICKFLGLATYPTEGELGRIFKTHNFSILKLLAGLDGEIAITKNKALFDNWSTADEMGAGATLSTIDRIVPMSRSEPLVVAMLSLQGLSLDDPERHFINWSWRLGEIIPEGYVFVIDPDAKVKRSAAHDPNRKVVTR